MPARPVAPPCPDRSAQVLAEAVRRVDAAIPGEVDLDALRQALETEMAKGPCALVKLMKVGRRRALDRINRTARKDADRPINRATALVPSDLGVTHRRPRSRRPGSA